MPKITKQTMKPAPKPSGLQSAWEMVETFSLLLYGVSGSGKTRLWATWPKPILALICSGGTKPGELRSINTPEYRKSITPYIVDQSTQAWQLLETASRYATVVLDHATGFQDLILKEILGLEEIPVQKAWGTATLQQYGQRSLQCREFFRAFLSLSQYRVVVAQEATFDADSDAGDLIRPHVEAALSKGLVEWLNPACDYIGQMVIRGKTEEVESKIAGKTVKTRRRIAGENEHCLRTIPDEVYRAKFRVPPGKVLPPLIPDPTFAKIEKIISA